MDRRHGVSATSGRQRATRQGAVIDALLAASAEYRTAQDIYAELRQRGEGMGLTTVYRHLRLLADERAVDVVRTAGGELAYRRCQGEGHHYHLVCRACGHTVELSGTAVERSLAKASAEAGFSDLAHTVEAVGTCSTCA
jgi:Fur family transcriptional regulator, ferric uptake regulator